MRISQPQPRSPGIGQRNVTKKGRTFSFALYLMCLATSVSADNAARSSEVAEIVRNLIEVHPNGLYVATNSEFAAFANGLEERADGLTLAYYVMQLHKLFSFFADGHTAVLSLNMSAEPFVLRLPILVELFADGMYVTEAKDEALPLLGGKVLSVGGVPINEVLQRYLDGAQGDNSAFAMRWSSFLLAFPGWLHGLGIVDGEYTTPIAIEVRLQSGAIVTADLIPRAAANEGRKSIARERSTVELMAESENSSNFVRHIAQKSAAYISVDTMQDTEQKSFSEFTSEVVDALEEPSTKRVIVDLRRNGGGNNMLAEKLRRSLARSKFNMPGGLYVLIGPRTFSAAMNFATRLERETEAIFVGEPTGGAPNHYGDAKYLVGSITGIEYLVSTVRWQDSAPFDERIWLLPDIPAVTTMEDFASGQDTALAMALAHIPASPILVDSHIGMPWERLSQTLGWEFFFQSAHRPVTGPAQR